MSDETPFTTLEAQRRYARQRAAPRALVFDLDKLRRSAVARGRAQFAARKSDDKRTRAAALKALAELDDDGDDAA